MTLAGYHGDLFSNRPGIETCSINAINSVGMFHNCDVAGGASGGPLFTSSGLIIGVQSGHAGAASCLGDRGNNAANGRLFSFAPDNAGGLATSYLTDGRPRVWATDKDWTLVAARNKVSTDASAGWNALDGFDSGFNGGRKIAASNLQDNREVVWVMKSDGTLVHKWQTALGGGFISTWAAHSTPTTIKNVAVTGGQGVRTQIFVLGTNNTIYTQYKSGDSNSAWTAWQSLGTQSGARASPPCAGTTCRSPSSSAALARLTPGAIKRASWG